MGNGSPKEVPVPRMTNALLVSLISASTIASGQVLNEVHKLTATDGAGNDQFGISVAIDGQIAIVGASKNDDRGVDSGSAYLFNVTTGTQLSKLLPPNLVAGDEFGISVDLSGSKAIVGAWGGDRWSQVNCGTAFGYDISNPSAPVQQNQFWQHLERAYDRFGLAVSISGGNAIVGAPYATIVQPNTGLIYFFNTNTWQQSGYTYSPETASWDLYGGAVAMDGSYAITGAQGHDGSRGAAFFYGYNPYTEIGKVQPADTVAGDMFGYSTALHGVNALIGAPRHNGEAGAVYHYNVTNRQLLDKITAPDGASGDWFGLAVAVDGHLAVIGSPYDRDNGAYSGSAYVYNLDTNQQIAKLMPSDGAAFDEFGYSVGISGDIIVVGTRYDDDRGTDSGSVYVFDLSPPEPCNPADLATPYGLLDLADVTAFVTAFMAIDPAADLDGNGLHDLADILAFVNAFNAGCP